MPSLQPTESDDILYVYGFLESVERPKFRGTYNRTHLVFDAVEARWFEEGNTEERTPERMSIIRILTTEKRIRERFNIDPQTMEGGWYQLTLQKIRNRPVAWVLDGQDYSAPPFRTNLVGMEALASDTKGRFGSKRVLSALTQWCSIPRPIGDGTSPTTRAKSYDLRVLVLDVGQANCSAIYSHEDKNSTLLGYFDVGRPAFFHQKTFPKAFTKHLCIPPTGFVALSHWDFDHYSLALVEFPDLQKCTWYAPDQSVGPTAARLQSLIGTRLHFVTVACHKIATDIALWRGTGSATDRNNSGYVLRAETTSGAILLTGDVSYNSIPKKVIANLAALGVSHHGGNGCSNPPAPNKKGRVAAISYGAGNRYGHPDGHHVGAHAALNWVIKRTATEGAVVRGDIWLP
ncbi:MAG: hypothetical protein M3Q42_10465 [Pseudomonadota bacterium]|nr:hypothetical protein [Pseudomonadota bacterium]